MVDSQDAENVRQRRSCCAQSLHVPQGYASVSSLAVALLDSLFEHPATCPGVDETHDVTTSY